MSSNHHIQPETIPQLLTAVSLRESAIGLKQICSRAQMDRTGIIECAEGIAACFLVQ